MQRLCSGSEKCRQDIRLRLGRKGMVEKDIQWVIDQLEDEHFVDEERYTGFYVRDKYQLGGWGKIKIAYNLKQKNIPENIIRTKLEDIDPEEYAEKLRKVLSAKNQKVNEQDPYKRKMKLMAFAAQRGFESGLIYDEVEKLIK